MRLRFTMIFAARISYHSIDNNVKMFMQTQTHSKRALTDFSAASFWRVNTLCIGVSGNPR